MENYFFTRVYTNNERIKEAIKERAVKQHGVFKENSDHGWFDNILPSAKQHGVFEENSDSIIIRSERYPFYDSLMEIIKQFPGETINAEITSAEDSYRLIHRVIFESDKRTELNPIENAFCVNDELLANHFGSEKRAVINGIREAITIYKDIKTNTVLNKINFTYKYQSYKIIVKVDFHVKDSNLIKFRVKLFKKKIAVTWEKADHANLPF